VATGLAKQIHLADVAHWAISEVLSTCMAVPLCPRFQTYCCFGPSFGAGPSLCRTSQSHDRSEDCPIAYQRLTVARSFDVSGPVVVLSPIAAAQAVSAMSEAQKRTSSFVKPRATGIPPTTGPMMEPELADDAWCTRTSHAQLSAAWYDLAVRCTRCRLGVRHRQMLQAPPGGRVPKLPQRDRCPSPRRARYPHRHG
jgi:hypothetical protein